MRCVNLTIHKQHGTSLLNAVTRTKQFMPPSDKQEKHKTRPFLHTKTWGKIPATALEKIRLNSGWHHIITYFCISNNHRNAPCQKDLRGSCWNSKNSPPDLETKMGLPWPKRYRKKRGIQISLRSYLVLHNSEFQDHSCRGLFSPFSGWTLAANGHPAWST